MCACWILYNSASSGNLGTPLASFLFHMDFLMGLALYYSNYQTLNFAKTYRIIKRNAVWANADNYKWLQASSSHNISQMASIIVLLCPKLKISHDTLAHALGTANLFSREYKQAIHRWNTNSQKICKRYLILHIVKYMQIKTVGFFYFLNYILDIYGLI